MIISGQLPCFRCVLYLDFLDGQITPTGEAMDLAWMDRDLSRDSLLVDHFSALFGLLDTHL